MNLQNETGRQIHSELGFALELVNDHPIWGCRLLKAFELEHLSAEDLKYIQHQQLQTEMTLDFY